jgi:predicted N-acyltransferase
MTEQIEIFVSGSIAEFDPKAWDECAVRTVAGSPHPLDPFTTHRFLTALEVSGSVGAGTGWAPRYLGTRQNGQLIAVAPLYAKGHSQGEYVFDFAWAQAYENAGGAYYPKLQIAVPFTPATGRRLLCREGFETAGQAALVQGAVLSRQSKTYRLFTSLFAPKTKPWRGAKWGCCTGSDNSSIGKTTVISISMLF